MGDINSQEIGKENEPENNEEDKEQDENDMKPEDIDFAPVKLEEKPYQPVDHTFDKKDLKPDIQFGGNPAPKPSPNQNPSNDEIFSPSPETSNKMEIIYANDFQNEARNSKIKFLNLKNPSQNPN